MKLCLGLYRSVLSTLLCHAESSRSALVFLDQPTPPTEDDVLAAASFSHA
jgi:hypothetical protein